MDDLRLTLRATDGDEEHAHTSALELRKLLDDECNIDIRLRETTGQPGNKGDPITVGALALTFLTSGSAVALFKVLEAYVSRKRSLELEFARPDGKKLVLKTDDVSSERIEATRILFRQFFEE